MRKAVIALICLLLAVGGVACRQVPPTSQTPLDPSIKDAERTKGWLDSYKSLFVGTTLPSQSETLVLISLGQVNTLGYLVEIGSIVDGSTEVVVEARLTYPDSAQAQLVHPNTPYILKSIPTTKPIVFRAEDPTQFIPILVGVPEGFLLHEDSSWLEYVRDTTDSPKRGNIVLGTTPNRHGVEGTIMVEGLARVFEAYVEYDFLDQSGRPFGYGAIQAATAGPDWGYFSIKVNASMDFSAIRVYSTSAKDGSIQDLVIIRP